MLRNFSLLSFKGKVESITKRTFFVLQSLAIVTMIIFYSLGLFGLLSSLFIISVNSNFPFIHIHVQVYDILIKNIFHYIEFLFIAPIPLLIVLGYKEHVKKVFPQDDKDLENPKMIQTRIVSPIEAKQTFVASIIGVLATHFLNVLFQFFSPAAMLDAKTMLFTDLFYLFGVYLVFLLILIYLYKILASHS